MTGVRPRKRGQHDSLGLTIARVHWLVLLLGGQANRVKIAHVLKCDVKAKSLSRAVKKLMTSNYLDSIRPWADQRRRKVAGAWKWYPIDQEKYGFVTHDYKKGIVEPITGERILRFVRQQYPKHLGQFIDDVNLLVETGQLGPNGGIRLECNPDWQGSNQTAFQNAFPVDIPSAVSGGTRPRSQLKKPSRNKIGRPLPMPRSKGKRR